MHPISICDLRSLIRLDAGTGELFWLPRSDRWFSGDNAKSSAARWNGRWAGTAALASPHNQGYTSGSIFGRKYLAHRVVYALSKGEWPAGEVDHIDRDRRNNQPENLRDASRRENQRNKVIAKPGASIFSGVTWHKGDRRWQAQCRDASGRQTYLGSFPCEAQAAKARDEFASKQHGQHAALNFPESRP